MRVRLSIILAAALVAVSFAGCGTSESEKKANLEALYVANAKEAPVEASPEQAVAAVYQEIEEVEGRSSETELSSLELEKLTGITSEEYLEVVIYNSSAKEGLADVFVIKPYPSLREDVRSKLLNYREMRMREFENFDILDSYAIAKKAVIYDQGEYLVMLMVRDNDAAQAQIDRYIPQS